MRAFGEADAPEQVPRALPGRLVAAPRDQRREEHVLLGGQRGEQVEELEDEADLVAAQPGQPAVAEPVVALAAEQDVAGAGGIERPEEVEQRALPGARRPHDGDHLPPADLDVDAVERVDGGVALAVDLGQPTCLQCGYVHAPHCVVGADAPDVGRAATAPRAGP